MVLRGCEAGSFYTDSSMNIKNWTQLAIAMVFACSCFNATAETLADQSTVTTFSAYGAEIEVVVTRTAIEGANRKSPYSGAITQWPPPLTFDQAVERSLIALTPGFVTPENKELISVGSVSLRQILIPAKAWVYCVEIHRLEGPTVKVVVLMDGTTLPMRIGGKNTPVVFEKLDQRTVMRILNQRIKEPAKR
jgi:hypothetical protein